MSYQFRSIMQLVIICSTFSCQAKPRESHPLQSLDCIQNRICSEKPIYFSEETALKNQILFFSKHNDLRRAINLYRENYSKLKNDDSEFSVLEDLALIELSRLPRNPSLQKAFSFLLGAKISQSSEVLSVYDKLLELRNPFVQHATLANFSELDDDRILPLLQKAAGSEYLPIVFEALYQMGRLNPTQAYSQVYALCYKLGDVWKPDFPLLFANIDSKEAIKQLRQLLFDKDPQVSLAVLNSIRQKKIVELASDVSLLLETTPNIALQESAICYLSEIGDVASLSTIENLATSSPHLNIRLTAKLFLYKIGVLDQGEKLIEEAQQTLDPFAIFALSSVENAKPFLRKLLTHPNTTVRTNATLALLYLKDEEVIDSILDLITSDTMQKLIMMRFSPGQTLTCYVEQTPFKASPLAYDASLAMKNLFLMKLGALPEQKVLIIAQRILNQRNIELLPILMECLERFASQNVIDLLRQYISPVEHPLVRGYCMLTLLKLEEDPIYEDNLKLWVNRAKQISLIGSDLDRFLNSKYEKSNIKYELLKSDTQLFIEILEVLAQNQRKEGIDLILETLASCHEDNKPIIAGLLIQALQ